MINIIMLKYFLSLDCIIINLPMLKFTNEPEPWPEYTLYFFFFFIISYHFECSKILFLYILLVKKNVIKSNNSINYR